MFQLQEGESVKTVSKIYGVFLNRMEVEHVMEQLKKYGIEFSGVSILIPCLDDELTSSFLRSTALTSANSLKLGGVFENLSNVTLYQNNSLGHYIVAGPLSEIAGLGLQSQDTIKDFLQFCGVPTHELSHYTTSLEEKCLIMGLESNDFYQLHQIRSLLKSNGARHICTASKTLDPSLS